MPGASTLIWLMPVALRFTVSVAAAADRVLTGSALLFSSRRARLPCRARLNEGRCCRVGPGLSGRGIRLVRSAHYGERLATHDCLVSRRGGASAGADMVAGMASCVQSAPRLPG